MEGPSTLWLASMLVSGAACVAGPMVVVTLWCKHKSVSWRVPLAGAGVFFVSQVVLRIPLTTSLGRMFSESLTASTFIAWTWLFALAFSAGLFEDGGRWLGYRSILTSAPRDIPVGVAYGLGHGGLEAVLLVGVTQLATALQLSAFDPAAGTHSEAVLAQWRVVSSQAGWVPLLAIWERASAMLLHVGLSLVVLRGVVDRKLSWLALAVVCHGSVNFVALTTLQGVASLGDVGLVVVQLVVTILAALVFRWALALHGKLDEPARARAKFGTSDVKE